MKKVWTKLKAKHVNEKISYRNISFDDIEKGLYEDSLQRP
jgi:hypothetical protein